VRNTHPANVLKNQGLDQFADHLNWIIEDDLPDRDELEDEVSNMLSVFEPTGALPAEFKSDDTRELSEKSRMYREFKNIVLEQASQCPSFYIRLTQLLTREYQVKQFFGEINRRIDRALKALDEYIEKGPTNRSSEALDVVACAARLRNLVQAVEDYRKDLEDSDDEEQDEDDLIERLAAAALLKVLDEVTSRNYDAYADSAWGMGMSSSSPGQNNLFVCLIGLPSEEEPGFFVLDSLRTMGSHIIRHHSVALGDIEVLLRNTPETSPAYLNAFRTLLQDKRKRAASPSGGSSAKRTMQ
jgi:tetratricopeptide (TPR) repeat protein